MDVKEIEFKVKHEGTFLPAKLSVFQPKHSPLMYRVHVKTGKHGKVIMLYPKDKEHKEFYHYPLEASDALLAKKLITKIKTLQV